MTNVTPINDSEEHTEDSLCKCKPTVITENGSMIIIHNAFDKREKSENHVQESLDILKSAFKQLEPKLSKIIRSVAIRN